MGTFHEYLQYFFQELGFLSFSLLCVRYVDDISDASAAFVTALILSSFTCKKRCALGIPALDYDVNNPAFHLPNKHSIIAIVALQMLGRLTTELVARPADFSCLYESSPIMRARGARQDTGIPCSVPATRHTV